LTDKNSAAVPAGAGNGDRDLRIGQELVEHARAEGVSLTGPNGLLRSLTKTVLEAALSAELDGHLGL
jgi:putative transposase